MSLSTNNVTITDNSGILSTIEPDGVIVVTAGEAHDSSISVTQKDNVWTLTLLSDRKASSSAAESFIKSVNGSGAHMFASGESAGKPLANLIFTLV